MGTETDQLDDSATPAQEPEKKSVFVRVLDWLRAGYPEGIPAADRFPVIAVLKRRMTDEEVHQIVEELTSEGSPALADGVISWDEVEEHLAHVLQEEPTHDEIRRVSARLAAGGWPLSGPADEESGAA